MSDQPDLFDLPPSVVACAPVDRAAPAAPATVLIVPFPLASRIGKIRDVARKLVATKSPRHAAHYRDQVSSALAVHLRSRRVPADHHAAEIAAFWRAVDLEVARILHGDRQRPGGAG